MDALSRDSQVRSMFTHMRYRADECKQSALEYNASGYALSIERWNNIICFFKVISSGRNRRDQTDSSEYVDDS